MVVNEYTRLFLRATLPGGVPGFVADVKFFPDDDLCIILLINSQVGKGTTDKLASIVFGVRRQNSGL